MSQVKPKNQREIDAKAIREGLATGADQKGGQNRLDRPRRDTDDGPTQDSQKPKFRGITHTGD